MKITKMLFLILGFFVLSSCTVNPETDVRIVSISPTPLTIEEGDETVNITLEVRNGIGVYIAGYYVKYFYWEDKNKKYIGEEEDYQAAFTSFISGASYSDGTWESSTDSITVKIARPRLITYIEDNSLEEITAEIYVYGEDENDNYFETNKGRVALLFPEQT